MRYLSKPTMVNAITFDELTQFATSARHISTLLPDGPRDTSRFLYDDHPIARVVDGFVVFTNAGPVRFTQGDMLITTLHGDVYPCRGDIFRDTFTLLDDSVRTCVVMT